MEHGLESFSFSSFVVPNIIDSIARWVGDPSKIFADCSSHGDELIGLEDEIGDINT